MPAEQPVCLPSVKFGVVGVKVFVVQIVLDQAQTFAEPLEVGQLALAKEADRVAHVRIVAEAQNIIVGRPCFLFWYDYKCTTDPKTP